MAQGLDYHIHTTYLRCANETMTVKAIFERAEAAGLTSIAITDHLNTLDNLPKFEHIKRDIAENDTSLEVFFGCELNILNAEGELPYNEEARDKMGFELAIGGPHATYTHSTDLEEIIDLQHRLLCQLAQNPLVDVIVHPWWFAGTELKSKNLTMYDILSHVPESYTRELAQVAIDNGKAIEANAALFTEHYGDDFRNCYRDYFALLNDEGVTFSVCSDAHTINFVGSSLKMEGMLAELGVGPDRIWRPRKESAGK